VSLIDLSRADKIPGFMEISELSWLAETAKVHSNICEIGSWKGRSTRAMADNSQAEITIIDPFIDGYLDGSELRQTFENNLIEYLENRRISIIQMISAEAARILRNEDLLFDMIFIDGEHFYNYVVSDICDYLPLLTEGGLLCGHDYTPGAPEFGGVIKAVHELVPIGYEVHIPVGRIWEYRKI